MQSRLFHGNEQLQAKHKILLCQINQYARMAECKRLADAEGKEAWFQENKYTKVKIELTEPVQYYLNLQQKSEQALAEITAELQQQPALK